MDLRTFFFAIPDEEREPFAKRCGTSLGHLRNVAYGYKPPGPTLAVAIERESKKKVTRQEMYPETFREIWPEIKALKATA